MEVWKQIAPGYEVSTLGRVRSLKKEAPYILKPTQCHGYLNVNLHIGCRQITTRVHRLVALAFISNPLSKPQINHINGIKTDNRVENLEWATAAENTRHAHNLGLAPPMPKGEQSPLAKLTNEQAEFIRNNPKNLTVYELGAMFNIDAKTVSRIQLGQTYKDAGGKTRESLRVLIPDDIRAKIQAEYQKGVHGHGTKSLAKKFGVSTCTVYRIVNQ